jgi:glycosyltransferase involved in cell wall biosynthesis
MLLTIIIPFYNSEKYLYECINSVINQTYLNWTLILVNDGSTDSSLEICQNFATQDSRIIVFSQENKGQAAARNFGISKLTTPYVTFLDADDELSFDTLSSNMKILANTSIECLQYPIYWNYGTAKQHKSTQKQELINENFYEEWLINKKITWIVCDKIFKTSIFNKILFEEGIIYEDNLLVAKMLDVIDSIYLSDKGVYYYYTRPNSTTTSKSTQKKEEDSFYVTFQIAKILKAKSKKQLLIMFLIRLINIKKSLNYNFKIDKKIPSFLFEKISLFDVFKSDIEFKEKVKLLLFRFSKL